MPDPSAVALNAIDQQSPQAASALQGAAIPENPNLITPTPDTEPVVPSAPTQMKGPDGKIYNVAARSFNYAVKNGYTPITEEEEQKERLIEEGVKNTGTAEGAFKNFGNEALFGIPNYISNKEVGKDQAEIDEAVRNRVAERDPVSHALSSTAGFIAPLLVPGVGEAGEAVGRTVLGAGLEAAEKGGLETAGKAMAETAVKEGSKITLGRKILASAADMATQGAIYSAPNAAVQLAYGDPESAAESMLWGIGLSGALGAGGKLVGEAASAGLGKVSELLSTKDATGMSHLDNIARNILGLTDKQSNRIGPERLSKIVEIADQEGILSSSPETRMAKIDSLIKDSGNKVGEHLDHLDALIKGDDELKALAPTPSNTAQKFQQSLLMKFPEIMTETHSELLTLASKIEKDIVAGGGEPSFEKLQEIRTSIQKGKNAFNKDTPQAAVFKLADAVIKNDLESSAQAIFNKGELPKAFPDYLNQKARYNAGLTLQENFNPFKGTGKLPSIGMFGGLGKAAIGLHFGGLPGAAGALALDAFMKNKAGLLGKSVSFLRKVSTDPATAPIIGGLIAKEGANALAEHIGYLPKILSGSHIVSTAAADANPFAHITGISTAVGHSKDQQYDKTVDSIVRASSDLQTTASNVGSVAAPFTQTSMNLGGLVAQKKLAAIAYLNSQIPRNPNPIKAFSGPPTWKPSAQQKQEFMQKVGIVNNPMSVWQHYQSGHLTKIDRDTLQAVYPQIYGQMVNKIVATAYDPRGPALTSTQKMQLSMFTGQPLDNSLKNLKAIQSAIKTQPAPQSQNSRPGQSSPNFSNLPSLQTESQRRVSGA